MPTVSSVNFYGGSKSVFVTGILGYVPNQTKLINTDFFYENIYSPTFNTEPIFILFRFEVPLVLPVK